MCYCWLFFPGLQVEVNLPISHQGFEISLKLLILGIMSPGNILAIVFICIRSAHNIRVFYRCQERSVFQSRMAIYSADFSFYNILQIKTGSILRIKLFFSKAKKPMLNLAASLTSLSLDSLYCLMDKRSILSVSSIAASYSFSVSMIHKR